MTTRADVMTIMVLAGALGALAPAALHGQERKAAHGWTRRAVNVNARGDLTIAADCSRANHGEGWNVLALDATVTWVGDPAAQAQLVSTTAGEAEAGFLGIHGPDDRAPPGR